MSPVTLEQALQGEYELDWRETEVEDGETIVEAWYVKMPGCIAQGATKDEAIQKLDRLREPYLRKLDEIGSEIPAPDRSGEDTAAESREETRTFSAHTGSGGPARWGRDFGPVGELREDLRRAGEEPVGT